MPNAAPEIKKFLGLFSQANSFNVPDGAMEEALNIIISENDVVKKTRGFYQYFAPGSGTLNKLFLFQNKLLAAYNSKLSYFTDAGTTPNETGTETDLTGETMALTSRTARGLEENGNFYVTSDNGIMKIDAYNGKIFKSGAPPALDIRGAFLAANGPIAAETQFGVRALFGRRDANQNLIIGAPSDILVLTNSKVIGATYTSAGSGPYIVTATKAGHNLATGMTVIVTGGTSDHANGTYTITVTGADTFTYSTSAGDPTTGTLDYTATRSGLYEFSIPTVITSTDQSWFYQLYRTTQSGASSTVPTADFRLIEEKELSSAEISAGFIIYQDEVDDVLVDFAPELYTNPNSREGEAQANYQPPLAEDLALFQTHVFYGNCTARQYIQLDVVAAGSLSDADYIEVKVDTTTRRYVARAGVGNATVKSDSITNSTGDLQIDYTAHGLLDGDKIYIHTITGASLAAGAYYVVSKATNTFEISLTSGGASVSFNAETELYFEGIDNGTYPIFQLDKTSASVSVQLRNTARGIIRAINRDDSSVVVGNYISGISDTPGKIRITAKGFGLPIYLRASGSTPALAFAPVLPSSFSSGTQVFSKNDPEPHMLYVAKIGEPEAVPLLNKIPVGSRNREIKRIVPLRNSLIVLKEDGVFKITGDSTSNFTVTQIDGTTKIIAADSAATMNNQVYFLSREGVCLANDSAVSIVSIRIDNRVKYLPTLSNIDAITSAVAYDSDRTYRISTADPNESTKTKTLMHNVINDTWTESDELFEDAVIGPSDTLYSITTGNKINKERKKGTRIDHAKQNYSVVVVSVASDQNSVVITSSVRVPQPGDFMVLNDIITRVESVSLVSGSNYNITVPVTTSLVAADTPVLYERLISRIKMAPYHGGAINRGKQWSQMMLHTRTPSISRLFCTFAGHAYGSSSEIDWKANNVAISEGWGFEPWGLFGWGMTDQINNYINTEPAPIIRMLMPFYLQRTTFIQPILEHREGGEAIDMQVLAYIVRVYKERTTK